MEYYTAAELATIKQEINVYLSNAMEQEIITFRNTATVDNKLREKHILLSIAREIIDPYQAVTAVTDGEINSITEEELQTLVEKVYQTFPTLKYPK